MIDHFPAFAKLVADRFQHIALNAQAFVTDVSGDDLYQNYLEAFPEGTNPLFKERTEHDCSCCKQFVRRVANVVGVVDGKVATVWDLASMGAPYPYNEVATILRAAVLDAPIVDLFLVEGKESMFGAETSLSRSASGAILRWSHFHTGLIPEALRPSLPDKAKGEYRTTVQVFERGLKELTADAVQTVLDLIDANNLYRGAEHRPAVAAFQKAQEDFAAAADKPVFLWTQAARPAARFRNTAIGTLVQDLSAGDPLAAAVGAFEAKVAPQNYKRTTALVTPAMVKKALMKIEELGIRDALDRRFARIEDVSVNDVLWADSSVQSMMKDSLADALMAAATRVDPTVDESRAESISIDDFTRRILPETTGMEVLLKNAHVGNLMSLTAPVHPEPRQLFRWTNDFAWSYGGNVADSIKAKVKRAGGNVANAVLRVSLSWENADDLDLHVYEPTGSHIHYGNRRGLGGGILDVDMNVGTSGPHFARGAVENVAWRTVHDGVYRIVVHNYTHRESHDVGFTVEVESGGQLHHFHYGREVLGDKMVGVANALVKGGVVTHFDLTDKHITVAAPSQEKWGLKTESYVKVDAVMLSPNYWGDNRVGNKHHFFVLDGALNDEATRGIYNEFLHPRLEEHRKVFEMIGDKTKCQPTEGQLSGIGFSSTKKDSVTVRVTQGSKQRLFNVQIGA